MKPPFRRLLALPVIAVLAFAVSGSASAAPINLAPPTISGSTVLGQTLAATSGSWVPGSYATISYRWQRCDVRGDDCASIDGATSATHTLTTDDVGYRIAVVATARDALGVNISSASLPTPGIVGWSTVATTNFVVHYSSFSGSGAITQTQAGDIAARAERAYTQIMSAGYDPPVSDAEPRNPDPRIDIYVADISSTGALGLAFAGAPVAPTYGFIFLNSADPTDAFTQKVIAHELFHVVQYKTYVTTEQRDKWLVEGTAEWMGNRVTGFTDDIVIGDWDMSLDCRDPNGTYMCSLESDYKNGGYSRWPFFEFLGERWGTEFNKAVLYQANAWGGALTGLTKAIEAKGSTLTDVFNDWSVAALTGSFGAEQLQELVPETYGSVISTGTLASLNAKTAKGAAVVTQGQLPTTSVPVNHLSTRYLELRRGSTADDSPCYKATLTLRVEIPSGVAAKPYFWWSRRKPDGSKEPAQPFSIDGSNATLTLPWDTCDWGSARGYVSLPNPSTNVDAADFKVSGTLVVDRNNEATASPPPEPVKVAGKTVDADSADVPRIQVFGPQLIRLASSARQLRVIVQSTDTGTLNGALGTISLGSAKLRPGSNDVRFSLPTKALQSVRSTSAAASALTLTPVAAGGAAGKAVTRKVVIERPAVFKRVTNR